MNAPLVSRIAATTVYEGDRILFRYPDGGSQVLRLQEHGQQLELTDDQFRDVESDSVRDTIESAGRKSAEEMEQGLFKIMRKAADSGQMFRGTVEGFGEQLVSALEDMDIGFDEKGEPTFFIVANPAVAARLAAEPDDADLQRRVDEIVEKKRHDWRLRESRRRLVE